MILICFKHSHRPPLGTEIPRAEETYTLPPSFIFRHMPKVRQFPSLKKRFNRDFRPGVSSSKKATEFRSQTEDQPAHERMTKFWCPSSETPRRWARILSRLDGTSDVKCPENIKSRQQSCQEADSNPDQSPVTSNYALKLFTGIQEDPGS